MQTEVIDGRLYLPPEDESKPNERVAMHPETNADQVLMSDSRSLTETLGSQVRISALQPEENNVLWLQITATRT